MPVDTTALQLPVSSPDVPWQVLDAHPRWVDFWFVSPQNIRNIGATIGPPRSRVIDCDIAAGFRRHVWSGRHVG